MRNVASFTCHLSSFMNVTMHVYIIYRKVVTVAFRSRHARFVLYEIYCACGIIDPCLLKLTCFQIIYIRKMDENGVQRVETIPSRRDSSKMKKERERERKELEKMQKKEKVCHLHFFERFIVS